jgi:hypothetical protein
VQHANIAAKVASLEAGAGSAAAPEPEPGAPARRSQRDEVGGLRVGGLQTPILGGKHSRCAPPPLPPALRTPPSPRSRRPRAAAPLPPPPPRPGARYSIVEPYAACQAVAETSPLISRSPRPRCQHPMLSAFLTSSTLLRSSG